MPTFRVVIRVTETSDHEYFSVAETNATARAMAMKAYYSQPYQERPTIGRSSVVDVVSTKAVRADVHPLTDKTVRG